MVMLDPGDNLDKARIGISVGILGHLTGFDSGPKYVLTLNEAKNLRRVLGIEIEMLERELQEKRQRSTVHEAADPHAGPDPFGQAN